MNEVTRSTEATSGVAAAYAERTRRALPSGWWGVALLIATEATLFGTLFATYYYLRFRSVHWPPPGVPHPDLALPLVMNAVLVATTVPMYLAVAAARAGRAIRSAWLVFLALFVQAGYFAMQMHLFLDDLGKFSPKSSAYGSIYFTLLGAHHAHVIVGMLLNAWLVGRLIRGLTNYRLLAVRVIALYWYFVNALAVCVVLTQVSPSL